MLIGIRVAFTKTLLGLHKKETQIQSFTEKLP